MIRPALSKLAEGTTLTVNHINDIINRTEYAADLLRQYKLVAGTDMYVELHYDGTRVSYLQQVAGGASPTKSLYTTSQQNVIKLVNNQLDYTQYAAYFGNGFVPPIIFSRSDFEQIYGTGLYLAITLKVWGINAWEYPFAFQSFFPFPPPPNTDFNTKVMSFGIMPDQWYFITPYSIEPETVLPSFSIVTLQQAKDNGWY
jgi:hypothetical protein